MRSFCLWLYVALGQGLHPQEYREPMYRITEKAKANSIRVHLLTLRGGAQMPVAATCGPVEPVHRSSRHSLGTERLELRLQWAPRKCRAMPCSHIPGTTAPWE